MNKDFYIGDIKSDEDINNLSIALVELEEVSRMKIHGSAISFTCADLTHVQAVVCSIDSELILHEIINEKRRVYKNNGEEKEMIFLFKNLSNINEATEIEDILSKYAMYQDVTVDFPNKLLTLTTSDKIALTRLNRIVDKVNPDIDVEEWKKPFRSQDIFQEKYMGRYLKISVLLVCASLGVVTTYQSSLIPMIGWLVAILICLEGILKNAKRDLSLKNYMTENTLIILACFFGWAYGAYAETLLVGLIYQYGDKLYVHFVSIFLAKIDATVSVPKFGKKYDKEKGYVLTPLEEFDIGDMLVVENGDVVLLGGSIHVGTSSIDTFAIDGSEVVTEVSIGDAISSGSLNKGDTLIVWVSALASQNVFSKLLDIAASSPTYESKTQRMMEKVAKYTMITFVILALVTGIVFPIVDFELYHEYLYVAAIVLTVASTYAYKQVASLGVLAGVAKSFKEGIIIKENSGLDSLRSCATIVYDRFDGVEVTEEELLLFDQLKQSGKDIIIFNDGPVDLINDQHVIYNDLTVVQKKSVMDEAMAPIAYIGDTAKDVELLQKAYVGIARGGLHDPIVTKNSDILIAKSELSTIYQMLKIAKKQKAIQYENTIISICSNLLLVLSAFSLTMPWIVAALVYMLTIVVFLLNTTRILK
ncbi:P-type ATPase [Tannockella kyphosi]|uniref:P-type ATPase n=1 Tax=Tannockella kyphosi TaxID=2899121 RepID=UPI00201270C0|nr:hypothetical protein [Tannockella kyphosi]